MPHERLIWGLLLVVAPTGKGPRGRDIFNMAWSHYGVKPENLPEFDENREMFRDIVSLFFRALVGRVT